MLHKTALATAASVAGVFLAGAVAVGANIGILGSNGDQFGELSAFTAPVAAPATTVAGGAPVVSSASATPAPPAPAASETVLEVPGIAAITVAQTASGLALVAVQPAAGWTWAEGPADGLDVVLRSSTERVVVTMWLADGQLRQAVERAPIAPSRPAPTIGSSPSPAPASPAPASPTTTRSSRERHDDDHDEDRKDHEFEGADDDD